MNTNIADRPLSLAGHLRNVAGLLRTGSLNYNWKLPESCNCGLVARAITGKTELQLASELEPLVVGPHARNWRNLASKACPITGVPEHALFRQLHDAGMQYVDFHHLEFQSNEKILSEIKSRFTYTKTSRNWMGRKKEMAGQPIEVMHDSTLSLICYLESWASLIEAYQAERAASAIPQPTDAQLETVELRPLVIHE